MVFFTFKKSIFFLAFVITAFVANDSVVVVMAYKNVYGEELQPCSMSGMALTGFTRNGFCTNRIDDRGSHHICIDLSSASGGNFCDVTGQPNWCSSSEMPCHEDPTSRRSCAIEHWCVCQWAFASYIDKAGGCDQIQNIQCDAINIEAMKAYKTQKGYEDAYQCLVERCGLHPNTNFQEEI